MTTITLELPEEVAAKVREAGLLAPDRMVKALERQIREEAFTEFFAAADRFRQASPELGKPLPTEEEIVALCKEVRREMRREARGE